MKKIKMACVLGLMVMGLTGCDNAVARSMGGTVHLQLEPNQKLMTITWKDSELWYLTRPMKDDEEAEVLTFQEKSEFGVLEGKVVITETKNK